jgi:virginiamycin A acetyltransferase
MAEPAEPRTFRSSLRSGLNLMAVAITAPCALTCWMERRLGTESRGLFYLWTHVFAVLPGMPGMFLRRAFYRWTLERCAENVVIEFGAVFTRRGVILDRGVYVGAYALIGSAWLREGCLVGSRASILSSGQHHEMLPSGRWSATDDTRLHRTIVGANTWIGEGAIVMADIGSGCMVAAGAVVSAAVPPGVMVAGNPARFVRRLVPDSAPARDADAPAISAVR